MILRKNIRIYSSLFGAVLWTLSAMGCVPEIQTGERGVRTEIPLYGEQNDFLAGGAVGIEMPENYSLFELGRNLSGGTVDLFDPSLAFFEVMPSPERTSQYPPLWEDTIFPLNGYYSPEDKEVEFYAVTMPSEDLQLFDPAPVALPVPLRSGGDREERIVE